MAVAATATWSISWSEQHAACEPLMTKAMLGDQQTHKLFENWLCTTVYDTHDQAIAAGIEPGAKVYGLPLAPGGIFSRVERNKWKHEKCFAGWAAQNRAELLYALYLRLPVGAVDKYLACANSKLAGIRCSVAVSGTTEVAFTAKWQAPEHDSGVLPVLRGSGVVRSAGLTPVGQTAFSSRPDSVLSEKPRSTSWSFTAAMVRDPSAGVVLDLDSTRGRCVAAPFIPAPPSAPKVVAPPPAAPVAPPPKPERGHFSRPICPPKLCL